MQRRRKRGVPLVLPIGQTPYLSSQKPTGTLQLAAKNVATTCSNDPSSRMQHCNAPNAEGHHNGKRHGALHPKMLQDSLVCRKCGNHFQVLESFARSTECQEAWNEACRRAAKGNTTAVIDTWPCMMCASHKFFQVSSAMDEKHMEYNYVDYDDPIMQADYEQKWRAIFQDYRADLVSRARWLLEAFGQKMYIHDYAGQQEHDDLL